MERSKVYDLIDGERNYQDVKWNLEEDHDENHSVADWLSFIRHHLQEGDKDIYHLNTKQALEQIRKIAGLTVACMETNETPART